MKTIETIREAADYLSDCAYAPAWSEKLHAIADSMEKAEPVAFVDANYGIMRTRSGIELPVGAKLFTYPHPADDARDAQRYRWLRSEQNIHEQPPMASVVWKMDNNRNSNQWLNVTDEPALDSLIDAAISAERKE